MLLGAAYVAYCMGQIVNLEFYRGTICAVGWVNSWGIFRPTHFLQAMINEFAMEVEEELYGAGPSDTRSEAGGSTAALARCRAGSGKRRQVTEECGPSRPRRLHRARQELLVVFRASGTWCS